MSFFQVDDAFAANAKAQALARRAMTGDMTGLAAIGLWTLAGSITQAKHADGFVDLLDLVSQTLNLDAAQALAGLLVEAGLWHGSGHECHRCPAVPEGKFYFHDWAMLRYERGEDAKLRQAKQSERNSQRLKDQVWARDRVREPGPNESERALCAYCLTEVARDDHRSERRPEVDHIDPELLGLDNLVVVCHACNRKKGSRRPAEAGMTLHVTERHRVDLARRGCHFEFVPGLAAPMWVVLDREAHGSGTPVVPSDPNLMPQDRPAGGPLTAQNTHDGTGPHAGAGSAPTATSGRGRGASGAEVNGSGTPVVPSDPNLGAAETPSGSSAGDLDEAPPPSADPEKIESPTRFSPDPPDPTESGLSRACARPHAGPRADARGRRQGRAGSGQGTGEEGARQGQGKAGHRQDKGGAQAGDGRAGQARARRRRHRRRQPKPPQEGAQS
ncbi:HNH endonuclease [Actinomyces procaprae]|uniref:HNH endonuclease n=1 Tax=Actinomyces procaprae TaxID=2560010 RepID=UPI0014451A6C|nr:HNH endonuclease [Actinomyces procaprae]